MEGEGKVFLKYISFLAEHWHPAIHQDNIQGFAIALRGKANGFEEYNEAQKIFNSFPYRWSIQQEKAPSFQSRQSMMSILNMEALLV